MKGVTKTIKNEKKEQERGSLSLLLSTLGTSLSGNILAGKGIVWARSGRCSLKSYKKGKGIVRTGYGKKKNGIFNDALSFNKLWNAKVLWEWTKI